MLHEKPPLKGRVCLNYLGSIRYFLKRLHNYQIACWAWHQLKELDKPRVYSRGPAGHMGMVFVLFLITFSFPIWQCGPTLGQLLRKTKCYGGDEISPFSSGFIQNTWSLKDKGYVWNQSPPIIMKIDWVVNFVMLKSTHLVTVWVDGWTPQKICPLSMNRPYLENRFWWCD